MALSGPLAPGREAPTGGPAAAAPAGEASFLSQIIETQSDVAALAFDPATVMRMIVERAQRLVGAGGAMVEMLEGDGRVCRAASGSVAAHAGRRSPAGNGAFARAIRTGQLQHCTPSRADVPADSGADSGADPAPEAGAGSLVAVPLCHGGRQAGALTVVSSHPDAFGPAHFSALRLMAGLLAAALAHADEFEVKKSLLAERTAALAALRQSEARFRGSFEHAAVGMALVSLEGRWVQVNRALCQIVGYSEAELLVSDFQTLTHPDDLAADLDFARRLLAGEIRDYHMTKRYLHKQGHVVWVLLSVSLVRDEAGRPSYFIGQIQDVGERKRAEEALRASEGAYRTTFELAGCGMAHTDLTTGRFLRVNRKLCDITGYTADELCCMSYGRITHPDDLARSREAAARMADGTAGGFSTEKRLVRKDGRVAWVSLTATPVRDPDGRVLHAVAMFQDVTERRLAEEAVRGSERQFRTLAAHAPVGIFQCDARGEMLFANGRWCVMTGTAAADAAGKGWADALHPDDRPGVLGRWQAAAAAGQDFAGEFRYLTPGGKITWARCDAVPLRDDAGRLVGYLGTATDVTDRKRGEWLESDRCDVLQLVAQDRPLSDVLDRLVHLVERQADDALAAVMMLDAGDLLLHAPNLPDDLARAMRGRLLPLASALAEGTWGGEPGGAGRGAGQSEGQGEEPNVCGGAPGAAAPGRIGVSDMAGGAAWRSLRRLTMAHGLKVCWAVPVRSNDGTPLGMVAVHCRRHRHPTEAESAVLSMVSQLAAISIEHHQTTKQLAHLVRHDRLTGLPNRLLFEDRAEQALAAADRTGRSAAVLVLDLDRFKSINDTLGHQAGDALLQQFAHRLRGTLRQSDTLARVGGDEFLLLLPEIARPEDAALVAGKLVAALAAPFAVGGRELHVTSSIGIALYPRDGSDSATLQRAADAAMYRAKQSGRNRFAGAGDGDVRVDETPILESPNR